MKNRLDLIKLASKESGFTKGDMEIALDAFISATKKIVKSGDGVNIAGFGKLYSEVVPARNIYDLNNGGFRVLPEFKRPKAKFSELFKAEINKCDSLTE